MRSEFHAAVCKGVPRTLNLKKALRIGDFIMNTFKGIVNKYNNTSLILRIVIGLIIGVILGLVIPGLGFFTLLGNMFVRALRAIAPILVFALIISSLASGNTKFDRRFGVVIFLYMISTFLAAVVSVLASFIFPVSLKLATEYETDSIPQGISEVLSNLLTNMVSNPITAIAEGNYICILLWSIMLGIAFKSIASETTKSFLREVSAAVSQCVKWIINLAPFGILGLIYTTVSTTGLSVFTDYGKLLLVLVGSMLVVALIVDPLISFIFIRRNPYPLVFRCLRESGITAFFTRSSAANIPVNMRLCERLKLDKDMYSVSIPLGATINMDGAAITITVMTLAAATTLGITVDVPTAVILSVLSAIAACGASGVAGGSLLLIPMACSLFGIPSDVAMQVVGIGFIIGVIQDSVETALNSAGDVMFAATAEYYDWIKEGRELPDFLGGTLKTDL